MNKTIYDIAIIGAGASGLMLAANLDMKGSRGIILEGSSCIGSKILMSGGGHCNITHGGPVKDFIHAYGNEGPSLRRCLYRHSNLKLAEWMIARGLELADENGALIDVSGGGTGSDGKTGSIPLNEAGRIFPASMRSRDVLDLLLSETRSNGWEIRTGAKVCDLAQDPECGWLIGCETGETVAAQNAVIATGGITYPETGSDGSMFGVLKKLGAEIIEPRPALAPVYVKDYPYSDLSGVSLSDVTVTAFSSDASCTCKGKAARMKGDVLFTHNGLSGPAVLNISKYAAPGETIRLCYNRELTDLPKRMQRMIRDRARGPLGDVRTNILASLLDHDDFTVTGVDERGMVTAGGVSLDGIDLSAMRLRLSPEHHGIYITGEAIAADGITGGYNLQLCWSTACTAADALRK